MNLNLSESKLSNPDFIVLMKENIESQPQSFGIFLLFCLVIMYLCFARSYISSQDYGKTF